MVGAASSEVVDGQEGCVVVDMERTKDDEGVLGTNACPTERMAVKTIAADMRTIVTLENTLVIIVLCNKL